MARTYGHIPGNPSGTAYRNRDELLASGVHRQKQAGIWGGEDGAESIVVSGGYPDDKDYGHEIIYTGQGGRDPATRRQVEDQTLTRGNLGLAREQLEGNPVRVVRGAGGNSDYSPSSGLRYDGLYQVMEYWPETGRDGCLIWRFRLVELGSNEAPIIPYHDSKESVSRVEANLQRLVRNTTVASHVKRLYSHRCQVCGIQLTTPAGPYIEAAHIRGLGRPHNGPDVSDNILCLCPNHHVLFDEGAIYVDGDWHVKYSLTDEVIGPLRTIGTHTIDESQLAYHRNLYGR